MTPDSLLLSLFSGFDEALDGIGRLSAVRDPLLNLLEVKSDLGGIGVGVVAFNLLDARGVISATERMGDILRVRTIAKACCASYMKHVVGVDVDEKEA